MLVFLKGCGWGYSYLSEEPGGEVPKCKRVLCHVVVGREFHSSLLLELALPLFKELVGGFHLDEKNPRGSLDEPLSVKGLDAAFAHGIHCSGHFFG